MDYACAKTGLTDETVTEVAFACGHVEMLSAEGRKSWSEYSTHHEIARQLELKGAEIWAITRRIKRGDKDVTDQYLQLIRERQELEKRLFDLGTQWLSEE